MSYILQFSLQNIALVKISSILWNRRDIRTLIENFNCMNFLSCITEEKRAWKKIEAKVLEKVKKLRQPKRLKEKISSFIRPMGWQILKWIEYHCLSQCAQRCYLVVHIPIEFAWTPHGTIDRRETAKILIKDRTVDIATRYKLAYIYCLEDEVGKVWSTVPYDCLHNVYTLEDDPGIISERDLVSFWSGDNKLGGSSIRCYSDTSSLINAFRNAVESGSKAAAEYFLKRLSPIERGQQLVNAGQGIPDVEVLCFLLAEMNEEQRMLVFQSNPHSVLLKVFDWPYMSFFVETANRMWDCIAKYGNIFYYSPLTAVIVSYVNNGYEEGIYQKIFKELWQCACKRFGAHACATPNLLLSLFYIKDKENISLIFQDMSFERKQDFILSSTGFSVGQHLMRERESDLLEFYMKECLPSKREIKEYKKRLKESKPSKQKCDMESIIDEFYLMFR